MKGCKKVITDFNEINMKVNFRDITHGGGTIRYGITDTNMVIPSVPKELMEELEGCGFLDGEKDDYRRNLTSEAIETFKNIKEQQ